MAEKRKGNPKYRPDVDSLNRVTYRRVADAPDTTRRSAQTQALQSLSAPQPAPQPTLPDSTEERMLMRRDATIEAIRHCRNLSREERSLLHERFGGDKSDRPSTLEEVANRFGVSRLDVRKMEMEALDKVRASSPELDAMYQTGWLQR
jgi:DNA-directed RNA polymerase sigma subunit (sigma70/sigma32)